MLTRQQLDRIVQKITGQDIRLAGFWTPLPRMEELRAEYARELGVSEAALLRCQDLVDVLDLTGNRRPIRQQDAGQRPLL